MSDQPLTDALDETFRTLDEMLKEHQYASAYARSQERLAFVHNRVDKLLAELRVIREVVTVLRTIGEAQAAETTLREIRHTLRLRAPAALRSPAPALASDSPDLLLLVEYLAAGTELVRGCRVDLLEQLTNILNTKWSIGYATNATNGHSLDPLIAALHAVADTEEVATLLTKLTSSEAGS